MVTRDAKARIAAERLWQFLTEPHPAPLLVYGVFAGDVLLDHAFTKQDAVERSHELSTWTPTSVQYIGSVGL